MRGSDVTRVLVIICEMGYGCVCDVVVTECACCVWVLVGGEMSIRTNLWDKGLISAGRSAKTTPLLTIPRHIFKSSTRDLSLPIFGIMFLLTQYMMLTFRLSLFALHRQRWISSLSSIDSDLEAFSHNLTDGSFAPLPFQARAFTNYLNQRFLSY